MFCDYMLLCYHDEGYLLSRCCKIDERQHFSDVQLQVDYIIQIFIHIPG